MGSSPTLSAKLDPDILLKLGDLKKASAAVDAGIRQIERDSLKAQNAGQQLDEQQQARLQRFEQVQAQIQKGLIAEEQAVERAKVFARATDQMAATTAKNSINVSPRRLQRVAGGALAQALLTGGEITPEAILKTVSTSGLLHAFGESAIAAHFMVKAVEKGFELYDKAKEDQKKEKDFAWRDVHGLASAGERKARMSQMGEPSGSWLRDAYESIGLDADEAGNTVRKAGKVIASLQAGDVFNVIGKSNAGKSSYREFGGMVLQHSDYYSPQLKNFSKYLRKETEKAILAGEIITPEIEKKIRVRAVEDVAGDLFPGDGNKEAANAFVKNLEKEAKKVEELRERRPRFEVEKEEQKKRTDEFVLNNFKQELWHRYRDLKVPANFRD